MKKRETLIGDVDAAGKRNSYPVQYFLPRDRGAWWAIVQWAARIRHNWATKHAYRCYNRGTRTFCN